jgi:bacillopeptidase F
VAVLLVPESIAADSKARISSPLGSLLRSTRADDPIAVIVRMADPVKIESCPRTDRARGRAAMLRALWARAESARRPVVAWLSGRGVEPAAHLWVINGLAARVPARLVPALAALPGVERVDLDREIAGPLADPGGPTGRPAASPAAGLPPEWNIAAVGAPDLWSLGFDGSGMVVASLDTGVDARHRDLGPRWRGGPGGWFDPHGEHATPYDRAGHGTQVMGLILGGDATGGAIGVAPGARWIAAKIYNDAGTTTLSRIHLAIQWTLDPDGDPGTDDAPDVVNNSWGLRDSPGECIAEFESDLAVLRAAGIATIFSAGNEGPEPASSVSPANNLAGFGVGAVDISGTIAEFSSRGPSACDQSLFPVVAAPGVDVRTADLTFGGLIPEASTWVTGTSFSAPHVSGGIAILEQAFPAATLDQIEASLRAAAVDAGDPGPDQAYGHGIVDLPAARQWLASGAACADLDADGHAAGGGVCGIGDCDDHDPDLWSAPGEAGPLRFLDAGRLAWQVPADPGGAADDLLYTAVRSFDPDDFVNGVVCVESNDGGDTTADDPSVPPIGGIQYYLVVAGNGCGTGPAGSGSDGTPRVVGGCP